MINWGLLQQNQGQFQNALAQGYQVGQQARQRREEKEFKNALAAYDPTKPETLKPIMERDPELGFRLRTQAATEQQAAQQRQQEQMGVFRRLLAKAGEGPEGYAQALQAAQQLGLDVSRAPQQYDPQWVQDQQFIFDALSDPEKADSIARDLAYLGFDDPSQPGYNEAARELVLMSRAKQGQDEYGRPTLEMPRINLPPQRQQARAAPMPRPEGMSDDDLFAQAREAVEAGANVEDVFRRLRAWGVKVQ